MRPDAQKKIPFKIFLLLDNAPGYPRALMKIPHKINVFMPANIIPVCSPWVKKWFWLSSLRMLRNAFHKAIAAIDGHSSDGSGQSKLKSL